MERFGAFVTLPVGTLTDAALVGTLEVLELADDEGGVGFEASRDVDVEESAEDDDEAMY